MVLHITPSGIALTRRDGDLPGYVLFEPINPLMLAIEHLRQHQLKDCIITACRN